MSSNTLPTSSDALSLIASAFDSSGQFFASVVPSLDLHKIQVTSALSTTTSLAASTALNVSLVLDKGVFVQTIAWVNFSTGSDAGSKNKKRRKRSSLTADSLSGSLENTFVAIGTNKGDILLYSPAQNSITSTLSGAHEFPITYVDASCTMNAVSSSIWSCDNSGKIVEWNLKTKSALRDFKTSLQDISIVKHLAAIGSEVKSPLLTASSSLYLIDANQPNTVVKTLPAFATPATNILVSTQNSDLVYAYSSGERNVSIISISKAKTVGLLVAQSNVKNFTLCADESVAAVITENGTVEVFVDPLSSISTESAATSTKSRSRKNMAVVSLNPTSRLVVMRPAAPTKNPAPLTVKQKAKLRVSVENAFFPENDTYLNITWIEHGTVPVFEKVEWKNQDGSVKTGDIELFRAIKVIVGGNSHDSIKDGADVATAKKYSENQTAVKSGNDLSQLDTTRDPLVNASKDSDDEDSDEEMGSDSEEATSLADRLTALEANEEKSNENSKESKTKSKARNSTSLLTKEFDDMSLKTPESFTLVLSQSLKTNDHALLESLLTSHNEENIKISVQRLESAQAVLLLERLADKISKSPGRAGQLMIWIKWTLIAHGGYLVQVPNLAKSLSSLHLTLSNKVGMIPRLLTLQGRVEMLRTQLQMRKDIAEQVNGAANRRAIAAAENDDDSDVDDEVAYIEDENMLIVNGEEDYDEDESEEDDDNEDDDEEDEFKAGNDFIEFADEDSENEKDDYSGKKGKALFKQDDDYDMSDVEAEGVEKLAVPDASDNDEEEAPKPKTVRKKGGKRANGSK